MSDNMAQDTFGDLEFFQGEGQRKGQRAVCLPVAAALTSQS